MELHTRRKRAKNHDQGMPLPFCFTQKTEVGLSTSVQGDSEKLTLAKLHQRIIQQGQEIQEIWQEQIRMNRHQVQCNNTISLYLQNLQANTRLLSFP